MSFSRVGERLIVGHRGSAGTHPENTLASFAAALDSGAEAVEADVRLTSDGVPVIIHDAEVGKTTDGTGLVHEMSLEEVGRARVKGGGSEEGIPTLRELLELVDGRDARVILEVKNLPGDPGYDPAHEGAVDALVQELAEYPAVQALIVSFNPRSIERCRSRDKELTTGFLTTAALDPRVALRYAREGGHGWVLPNVSAVLAAGAELVADVHAAGLHVGTWTTDDPADITCLLEWEVDAVITDLPAEAVRIRAQGAA